MIESDANLWERGLLLQKPKNVTAAGTTNVETILKIRVMIAKTQN